MPVPSIVDRVKDRRVGTLSQPGSSCAVDLGTSLVGTSRERGYTKSPTADWGAQAAKIIAEHKLKLDDELRALALAGSVNPGCSPAGRRPIPNRMADAYSARPQAVSARRQAGRHTSRHQRARLRLRWPRNLLLSVPCGSYFSSASLQMDAAHGTRVAGFPY